MSRRNPGPFLKSILVGTDFSLCAARAFELAVSLAASQGARIHLLHVLVEPIQAFDVAGALPYLDMTTQKEWEDATKKRLAAAVIHRDFSAGAGRVRDPVLPAVVFAGLREEQGPDVVAGKERFQNAGFFPVHDHHGHSIRSDFLGRHDL